MNLINRIEKNIFLSDWKPASNLSLLKELNIKRIVSVGNEEEFKFYKFHENIEYLKIFLEDSENSNISIYFKKVNDFIKQNDENMLIHCQKGISRSFTFVIFYLMNEGLNYKQAYTKIKKINPYIKPNKGFVKQLKDYYHQ